MSNNALLRERRRVGPIEVWLIALLVAVALSPILLADRLLGEHAGMTQLGQPAALTVRNNALQVSPMGTKGDAIVVSKGEVVDTVTAHFVNATRASWSLWTAQCGLLIAALGSFGVLWRRHHRGILRRHLWTTLGWFIAITIVLRALLLFSSASLFALPVAALALLVAFRGSKAMALTTGSLTALTVACMTPASLGTVAVLFLQACVPVLLLGRHSSRWEFVRRMLLGTFTASLSACAAYILGYHMAFSAFPEYANIGHSALWAALVGPWVSILIAAFLLPVFQWTHGDVSSRALRKLEKLSHPLLKQLAQRAPGTWQHSLAMAQLAEAAGRRVGANLPMLRVGAYYHDVGKLRQPEYFIENIVGGESSPHDSLSSAASRDAIFQHVEQGVQLAKDAKIPQQIIDFIRSHHANGILEYFWAKSHEGQKNTAGEEQYRYPGSRPQTPETGIVCICDAIESATRNLKTPSQSDLRELIHHIVFGKVANGQLALSGLQTEDLRHIAYAIHEVLAAAHALPQPVLQKTGVDAIATVAQVPRRKNLHPIRLDSGDLPSSNWRQHSSREPQIQHRDADVDSISTPEPGTQDSGPDLERRPTTRRQTPTPPQSPRVTGSPMLLKVPKATPTHLSEWEQALDATTSQQRLGTVSETQSSEPKKNPHPNAPPPPPPRNTIPLGQPSGQAPRPSQSQAGGRADSADGLQPGEMVIGAPPATHPERSGKSRRTLPFDEVTVQKRIPVPEAAKRGNEEVTEPSTQHPDFYK